MSTSRRSSLPERPNLEQLKKQAKELRATGKYETLAAAQRAIAAEYGFTNWPTLKNAVDLITLRRVIEEGNAGAVAHLVSSSPSLARATFDDGSTPLHVAAGENRSEIIEVLVRAGAPVQTTYRGYAHSALSWALTCWSYGAAEKLVELGAEPDLFCAAGLGRLDKVQAFWAGGTLRKRPSRTGSSRYADDGTQLPSPPPIDRDQVSDALYLACRCNRLEVARWLVDRGADPNWRGYAGATCLAWAEFSGNVTLCAWLRERGGSDEILDQQYQSTPAAFPLMVFAGWGFPKLLFERLTANRSLAATKGRRGTLLHAAALGGQDVAARILLAFGADRAATDPQGRTAADVAAAKGHAALAELLRPTPI